MKIRILLLLACLAVAGPVLAQPTQVYPIHENKEVARYTGSSANDNDVLFTASGTVQYDACMLMSTTGAVDVEVTLDGSTWSTAALSLQDFGATSTDPVLKTSALRMFAINGKYLGIRVVQNGAQAAAASMLCWKR